MRRSLPRFVCSLVCLLASLPLVQAAKPEEWRDVAGNSFRGEPMEIVGPFAIFRTSKAAGRRVVLQQLPPEACVRLHQAVGDRPAPVADWAEATADLSRETFHFTRVVREGRLVPAELEGRPEPLVYVVFFASHGEGKSWEMMGTAMGPLGELQRAFPDRIEGLYYGLRHNRGDHVAMATRMNLPWLVTEIDDQRKFRSIERLFPGSGYAMYVVTRDGVPLFGDNNPEKEDVLRILNETRGLLELARPDDPRAWPHRLHFLRAVQPVRHAQDQCEPLLVGNPLRADVLREHGVRRIVATLEVGSDGVVSKVQLDPASEIPEPLVPAVAQALEKALVVPAVDRGKFVAGSVPYRLEVTP